MFIADNSLSVTIANIEDVTDCGEIQEEHDVNLNKLIYDAIIINDVNLLGYTISIDTIKQTPKDFKRLKNIPFLVILMLFVVRWKCSFTIPNVLSSILKKWPHAYN